MIVPEILEIEFVVGEYMEIVVGTGAGCVKMEQWWC
jgi:hypothetical protein